jgi:hypothetical protein
MPELRRYRLMPVAFNAGHHILEPTDPTWEPRVRQLHDENRQAMVDRLRYVHGEANLNAVIGNVRDLGSDPWSTIGWHIHLWLEVRHAFVSGAYFPAAVSAGALGERILNHLLVDLADDCASDDDRRLIAKEKAPTYGAALRILRRWAVLEPRAVQEFDRLRSLRNSLVHFDPALYEDLRGRSLEAVTALRDAIDSQFGVLVPRRLIHGTPGAMFARKDVEAEPFFQHYIKPVALYVSPRHSIDLDQTTGRWAVSVEEPVEADVDSDEEFVRQLQYIASPPANA